MARAIKTRKKATPKAKQLPEFESFSNVQEQREGLRMLDLIFPHSKRNITTGRWMSLSPEDMSTIYRGRKRHIEGHIKTMGWHKERTQLSQVLQHQTNSYVRTYAGFVDCQVRTYVTYPVCVHRHTRPINSFLSNAVLESAVVGLWCVAKAGGTGGDGDGWGCVGSGGGLNFRGSAHYSRDTPTSLRDTRIIQP